MRFAGDGHESNGIRWSLSLGHLRYYGGPVVSERRIDAGSNRVTIPHLFMVAIGGLTELWGLPDLESASLIKRLWEHLRPHYKMGLSSSEIYSSGTMYWLGHLAEALEPLRSSDPLELKQCEQLIRQGRRQKQEVFFSRPRSAVGLWPS